MIGIVTILFMIFLIHFGVSTGEYSDAYYGIFFLTLVVWGAIKINSDRDSRYNVGCLPDTLFIIFLLIWLVLGADYKLAKNFGAFMGSYIIAVFAYIACIINNAEDSRTENCIDRVPPQIKYNISETKTHHHSNSAATNKGAIEPTIERSQIAIPSSFTNEDKERAIRILNTIRWEKLDILDKGRVQYVCRKEFALNPDDFKWVVGYLSGIGTPEDPKSPHSYMVSNLNGIEYKSIKVNKYFEGTVIYKYEEAVGIHEDAAPVPSIVKLSISKTKCLVEERFKKDPVAQYNLQLLNEKKAELKEKKEEYLRMRNWDNDDILISPSTSSTLDIEEYKEKIEDLKDEIEDLKDEIEEIRYELDEIRDSIEEEVEDEEWEREMEIF